MKRPLLCLSLFAALWSFSPLAMAGESLPNPLSDSQVGEWALFAIPGGYTQKQTVVARQGTGPETEIRIKIENILNGKTVNAQEVTEVAGEATTPQPAPEPGTTVTVKNETVAVKGANYPVTVITTTDSGGSSSSWYVSPNLPVYGLVKQISDGKTEIELLDFGWK